MNNKSKTRNCPAVGRQIKSIECGENRHRAYPCPADCPHSPFSLGNYPLFSDIEIRLDDATIKRAFKDPFTQPIISEAFQEKSPSEVETRFSKLISLFFNTRGPDGLLFGERWEKDGYAGLRGDEKLLFDFKRKTRISLLEVQTVIDSETGRCIDLLSDAYATFSVVDKSFAEQACRFQRALVIAYPSINY